MRVKIGNTWYNPEEVPIMIELTDKDKSNISNMLPEAMCYSIYPDGVFESEQAVLDWMEADKKLKEWKDYNE